MNLRFFRTYNWYHYPYFLLSAKIINAKKKGTREKKAHKKEKVAKSTADKKVEPIPKRTPKKEAPKAKAKTVYVIFLRTKSSCFIVLAFFISLNFV